jgi:CHASE3 domain sensor protein
MRSRAARRSSTILACLALGAAALFLNDAEHSVGRRDAAVREFDQHARQAATAISDARAGQRAYVASGQSAAVWMPKVAAVFPELTRVVDDLRSLAVDDETRKTLLEASATITGFAGIDRRARDYLLANQLLMASDVVFAEGGDAATSAAQQIESARLSEWRAFDAYQAGRRRLEAYALAGTAGLALVVLLSQMGAQGAKTYAREEARGSAPSEAETPSLSLRESEEPRQTPTAVVRGNPAREDTIDRAALALNATAELCTEFGRLQDVAGLKRLLARTADVMDARGLVIWLGTAAGADLQPLAAHGYSDQVLALMRPVSRNADNAAAAAYRTGALQIVPAKPGTSLGAVVAPLMGSAGCVGALAAEIIDNGEVSETVHALASIFAAQLAGLLSPAQSDASAANAASA